MAKERLDKVLVERGLAPSRERAQAMIMAGLVLVNDKPATKAGQSVTAESVIRVKGDIHPYVGRGGLKLEAALREFQITVTGCHCADVGSSTGGFTDCLLQNGAARVVAIDVGYNQLDWKLREDPRVAVFERTHVREVTAEMLEAPLSMIVVDLSFISLTKVLPILNAWPLAAGGATIVTLIKPQFEVGREKIAKGGIVRDEVAREEAVKTVCQTAHELGWKQLGIIPSPITGADGNIEFLAAFHVDPAGSSVI